MDKRVRSLDCKIWLQDYCNEEKPMDSKEWLAVFKIPIAHNVKTIWYILIKFKNYPQINNWNLVSIEGDGREILNISGFRVVGVYDRRNNYLGWID